MHNWLLLYGVPEKQITDKGSQILMSEWKNAVTFLGLQHIHTTRHTTLRATIYLSVHFKKSLSTLLKTASNVVFLIIFNYAGTSFSSKKRLGIYI